MKRNKPGRKMALIFAAFVICAVILGVFMARRYQKEPAGISPTPVPQQAGPVSITLFFAAPDGTGLVREGRNIDSCGDTSECVAAVVEELISGPLGELEPSVPMNTVLHNVHIENDQAVVDLDKGFVEGLPAGSSAEMIAVYSIVDSVAVNFPNIKSVKLLIDGAPVETLKGHLDLRRPLGPDFSMEKQ